MGFHSAGQIAWELRYPRKPHVEHAQANLNLVCLGLIAPNGSQSLEFYDCA